MISNAPPFSVIVGASVVLAEFSAAAQFVLKCCFFFVALFRALANCAVIVSPLCPARVLKYGKEYGPVRVVRERASVPPEGNLLPFFLNLI
jgi:hypothetical protein